MGKRIFTNTIKRKKILYYLLYRQKRIVVKIFGITCFYVLFKISSSNFVSFYSLALCRTIDNCNRFHINVIFLQKTRNPDIIFHNDINRLYGCSKFRAQQNNKLNVDAAHQRRRKMM